ncbi:MAG: YidC/Oxa1 family insertase periplasmic-domain containing protein, partial [Muribaculaceae bacterium]|nr:YidC/Oxa1 family insertase periplasmic-domain containing protein [Muribaculaceae bacterium]
MDKNTIIGMLLMCAVIFGFMMLQQPNKDEQLEQQQASKTEQAQSQQVANASVDTLTQAEFALLDTLVAKNGDIAVEGVNITSTDGKAAGTVKIDNKIINIASLNASTSDDPRSQNLAVQAVKKVIEKYAKAAAFSSNLTGENKTVKLENDSLAIEISTKGGVISRATLKGYKAYRTQEDYKNNKSVPVELINPENNDYSFGLNTDTQHFETKDFFFTPEQQNDSSVTMSMNLEGGAKWSLRYTLVKGTYMVRMEVLQHNMQNVIPTNRTDMDFTWNQKIKRQEAGKQFEERNSALYWKVQGSDDVENLSESGSKDKDVQERIKWISGKSQFFSTALIANQAFSGAKLSSTAYEEGKNS